MSEKNSNSSEKDNQIKEFGTVATKNKRGNIHCLNIIGQIEGHMILPSQNKTTKYEHVIPQLIAIEQDESIDGLLVILNTVGKLSFCKSWMPCATAMPSKSCIAT